MSNKLFEDEKWNYYYTIVPMMLFVIVFLTWAATSEVDEVVKGVGKVVPSGKTKIVQNFEGGIIESILVKEGDSVKKGQVLFILSNKLFTTDLQSKKLELLSFKASLLRLQATIDDKKTLKYPDEFKQKIPQIIENEKMIFQEDRDNTRRKIDIATDQVNQKKYKLAEARSKYKNLNIEYKLALENMKIQEKLYRKKVISKQEYLNEITKKQNIVTRLDEIRNSIPIIKEELKEAQRKVKTVKSELRSKMLNKYSTLKVEMNKLEESIKGNTDRELRRSVTSPVNGIVNKIYFNTVGGIVRAGDNMAQITPIEDSLSIEAKIKTSDRAFVWSGQKVSIEITAYDFSKYGLLDGKVISISSDSFEEKNGVSYYLVKVKADTFEFAPNLPILPGMSANINILTGKKTILQYILKPLKDIRRNALVEQ
jgi:HlyD family secretion protein/adhesin transport system membrane fusion protein